MTDDTRYAAYGGMYNSWLYDQTLGNLKGVSSISRKLPTTQVPRLGFRLVRKIPEMQQLAESF